MPYYCGITGPMNALEIKQSIFTEINAVDNSDTDLLAALQTAVKRIIGQKQSLNKKKVKTGVSLPDNFDIDAVIKEHLTEKYS